MIIETIQVTLPKLFAKRKVFVAVNFKKSRNGKKEKLKKFSPNFVLALKNVKLKP